MQPWDTNIAAAAEKVAEEFAERVDPGEKTYNSYLSLKDVRLEIEEVLGAAIGDWLLTKEQEAKALQHEQSLEEAAYDLEDAAYDQARDEARQATGVDEQHEAMMADRPEGRGLPF